jgi:hypothetical protein
MTLSIETNESDDHPLSPAPPAQTAMATSAGQEGSSDDLAGAASAAVTGMANREVGADGGDRRAIMTRLPDGVASQMPPSRGAATW